MLEIKNLLLTLNDQKYHFDLAIPSHSRVAICGPSGIGKTTLFNLIAGFRSPNSGSVSWKGEILNDLEINKRPIAYLLQSHNVFTHLNVEDNMRLAIYSLPLVRRLESQRLIDQILEDLELSKYRFNAAADLSGGQRQRVAIGRMLLQSKSIWLLDEPFNALDNSIVGKIQAILTRWQKLNNATILWTTHNEHEIMNFATHRCALHTQDDFSITSSLIVSIR